MLESKVEVRHLSKVYYQNMIDGLRQHPFDKTQLTPEDKIVLDNVSFVFNSGDIIGVIGRNGAGKSTLLSILAGVSQATDGELLINGKVTAVMTLGIGLREDLTGRANIYLDGEIQGKTRAEIDRFIDEIITFSELAEFIDKPVKVYSTGMKSRLAFSMLVGIEPEILIIDEALSAGDAFFAEKASKKIREICKKGKIVIIVSHSMATIESMCNRCIWLENGTIVMDGEPSKVTQSYLQKVKDADQQTDLKNYQTKILQFIENASYKLVDAVMRLSNGDYQQSIFYTKDDVTVDLLIQQQRAGNVLLRFFIERIDGLIISEESFDLEKMDYSELNTSLVVQFTLNSFVLNTGYYHLTIELVEDNQITSQLSRFFEVKNDHMAKGGVSILHYPAEIMLINEEMNLCSDSIEMIVE